MRSPSRRGGAQHAVAHGVVVGEQAHIDVAERHHDGAGERGGVHQVGAALIGARKPGRRPESAVLGIGIDDLDGLAGHGGHDVARPLGAAARHILHAGDEGRHRSGGFNWAMARMAPIMAAPPAISYFIFSMPSEGLMEMPPVSKVTPLPTSPRWRRLSGFAAGNGSRSVRAVRRCLGPLPAASPCRAAACGRRPEPRIRGRIPPPFGAQPPPAMSASACWPVH